MIAPVWRPAALLLRRASGIAQCVCGLTLFGGWECRRGHGALDELRAAAVAVVAADPRVGD